MKLDFHYLLIPKYAKWIIIALISFFSLLIIAEYLTLLSSPVQIAKRNETDKNLLVVAREDSQDLLKSSMFGVYVPNDLSAADVKNSMLNVTLVGILLADKNEESQVIIGSANGEEKTYKIGDSIPGGAVIERIMPSGILVERNGALERISLPKSDLIFEPIAKPLNEDI